MPGREDRSVEGYRPGRRRDGRRAGGRVLGQVGLSGCGSEFRVPKHGRSVGAAEGVDGAAAVGRRPVGEAAHRLKEGSCADTVQGTDLVQGLLRVARIRTHGGGAAKSTGYVSAKVLLNACLAVDAPVIMSDTSVTPINKAAAVADVRAGLRVALTAASLPGTPAGEANRPAQDTTAGMKRLEQSKTPMKEAAPPSRATSKETEALPNASKALPPARTTAPSTNRTLPRRFRTDASSAGRKAARGATAVAAFAGTSAAMTVSRVPASSPAITADGGTASVANVCPGWVAAHATRPDMTPTAAATPSTEAKKPTASASTITEPRICGAPPPGSAAEPLPGALGNQHGERIGHHQHGH